MKREDGFYWVRENGANEWTIGEFVNSIGRSGGWWGHGSETYCTDDDLAEIDERRILRQLPCPVR